MEHLQDEQTEKMHSEFTIDEETERKHRAGCVWGVAGFEASNEEVEKWAKVYSVDYDTCMKYKSFWRNLHNS